MAAINLLIIAALIATLVVLTLGLRSMANMWERIALQTLVVVLLIAAAILLNV
jgi:hypothetical protein